MLFSDSLLEVSAGRGRRGWSSVAAYVGEALLIALAVILPLWNTDALPRLVMRGVLMGPPPGRAPEPPPSSGSHHDTPQPVTASTTAILLQPSHIPPKTDMTPDPEGARPVEPPCTFCVVGAPPGPGNGGGGVIPNVIPVEQTRPAPPPKPAPQRVIVSGGVSQGYLLRQIQPVYPQIARAARVEGPVVLTAIIGRDGAIENLRAVSGPPLLVSAAIDAVRQWRYRPYLLNGQPVEVETQITVNFILGK